MKIQIAPSLLAADFSQLGDEVKRAEEAGADLIHVDVMDGQFVKNITIGAPVVEGIRKHTKLPLDVHLMIVQPERHIKAFLDAGADSITVHIEALAFDEIRKAGDKGYYIYFASTPLIDMERSLSIIDLVRKAGKKPAIAINPETPCELLYELVTKIDMVLVMTVWPGFGGQAFIQEAVDRVKKLRDKFPTLNIQVDGGVNEQTVGIAASHGANIFVAGTAVFRSNDKRKTISVMRDKAQKEFNTASVRA